MINQEDLKNKTIYEHTDKGRQFTIEDFDKVMKIFDETDFGCVGEKDIYKPGRQEQMLMMREVLRGVSADEKILVYDRLGEVLGYATIQETDTNWHIGEFAIDSEFRRQGIGRNFMSVIKALAIRCHRSITLETFDRDNKFFEKQGFKQIAEDDFTTNYRWENQRVVNKEENKDEIEL